MNSLFLGIGSNLGDRVGNLNNAVAHIEEKIGRMLISSSVYEAEPWGFLTNDQFLNLVIRVETNLEPSEVLAEILRIEELLGRIRNEKHYTSRLIDIDILLFNDQIINEADLKIPHSLIQDRKFVMIPLCEIAPEHVHPVLRKSMLSLLDSCDDRSEVELYRSEI